MRRIGRPRHSFRLLWAGQTVNATGTMVSTVALPLVAVQRLHASTLDVGLLEAVEWVPALLLGLPSGALIDRYRPGPFMLAACVGQATAMAAIPVSAALRELSLSVLLAAAAAAGFCGVFFQTAYSPYVRELVRPEKLARANSRLQAGQSAGRVIGPSIGGALVELVGAAGAVTADAASFLAAFLALWAIGRRPRSSPAPTAASLASQILAGLRYLRASPVVRSLVVSAAAANFFLTAIGAVEIVFLVRAVGVAPGTIGVLVTIQSAGALAGALACGRICRRVGLRLVARAALAITAPFVLLMPLARHGPGVAFFAVGGALACAGIAAASVSFATLQQQCCPADLLGRVTGAAQLVYAAAIPAGALVGGGLGELVGTRAALVALGAGYVLVALAILRGPLREAVPAAQRAAAG
jgi:MFS family permease